MLLKYLTVFGVSMVPLIELRGAIPIGTGLGLHTATNYAIAIVGNCLPIPFILLFINKILKWMRTCEVGFFNKISNWLFEKADKHRPAIEKYATFGLFVFVAIPLPGTGAWSGALVASVFGMPRKKAMLSIFTGVLTAGLIMTVGSQAVKWIINLF